MKLRLHICAATLLLGAVACTAAAPTPAPTPSAAPTPAPTATATASATQNPKISGFFDVGDHQLYIDCVGAGSPTFVIEPGEGQTSDEMADLKSKLAANALVCSYDRANHGQSGPAPTPRTALDVGTDLHALLGAAGVPGPYILIGHSAGGMFVQYYARTYADQVAGLLIMNPVPPCGPWLEQGLLAMTDAERADERAYYVGANDEPVDYCTSSQQIDEAPAPPPIPMEMLISTIAQCASAHDICGRTYSAYENVMRDLTGEWPAGHFSQVDSIHSIYVDHVDVVLQMLERLQERIANPAGG